jgi:hypothetical protein
MSPREAYSSVVVSRAHLTIGVVIALLVGIGVRIPGHFPLWGSVVLVVALALTAVYLSTARLVVGPDRISVGIGPVGRGRLLARADVVEAGVADLTRAQAVGLGLPWARRTTRLTVRPGPALVLRMAGGEVVRVSTPHPELAVRMIEKGGTHE